MRGEETFGNAPKLNIIQRLNLKAFGLIFIGYRQPKGWLPGIVPVYIVNCSQHGYFLDTPHGWKELTYCTLCANEYNKEKTEIEA